MRTIPRTQRRSRQRVRDDLARRRSRTLEALAARVGPSVVQVHHARIRDRRRRRRERGMLVAALSAAAGPASSSTPTATSSPTRTSSQGAHQIQVELLIDRPARPGEHRSTVRAATAARAGAEWSPSTRRRTWRYIKVDEEGAAGAGARRFRRGAPRTAGAGVRQPARSGQLRDARRRQRRRAPARSPTIR